MKRTNTFAVRALSDEDERLLRRLLDASASLWNELIDERRQFLGAAAALSGMPIPATDVAADGGSDGSDEDDDDPDYGRETVVKYLGDRPIETAKKCLTRVGSHSRYGFGELRLKPLDEQYQESERKD